MDGKTYIGRSNALAGELERCRDILVQDAENRALTGNRQPSPLILKTIGERDDVIERIQELDREFWDQ